MRVSKLNGVPYGFRSTLRTWLMENTNITCEITEIMTAHRMGSEVARAFTRSAYLKQRRHYMKEWGAFMLRQ